MPKSSNSRSAAFTLVELIVATAVCAILGAVAFACIFGSFGLWGRGIESAAALTAADAFDAAFSRDFASSVPGAAFKGDAGGCSFMTLRPSRDGDFDLLKVRYTVSGDGVTREIWPGNAPEDAMPAETQAFATSVYSSFLYAGTNSAEAAWSETWEDETPAFASLECSLPNAGRRVYMRRACQ